MTYQHYLHPHVPKEKLVVYVQLVTKYGILLLLVSISIVRDIFILFCFFSFQRFLRRLEQSIKQRDKLLQSPSDSCTEDINDGIDSPRVTSPLLPLQSMTTSINKTPAGCIGGVMLGSTSTSGTRHPFKGVTRQKRLVCIHPNEKLWRERERGLIHGGDLNSD